MHGADVTNDPQHSWTLLNVSRGVRHGLVVYKLPRLKAHAWTCRPLPCFTGSWDNVTVTGNAHVLTIGEPYQPVQVRRIGDMAFQRAFANSVVLPDGKVFTTGCVWLLRCTARA